MHSHAQRSFSSQANLSFRSSRKCHLHRKAGLKGRIIQSYPFCSTTTRRLTTQRASANPDEAYWNDTSDRRTECLHFPQQLPESIRRRSGEVRRETQWYPGCTAGPQFDWTWRSKIDKDCQIFRGQFGKTKEKRRKSMLNSRLLSSSRIVFTLMYTGQKEPRLLISSP